MIPTQQGVSEWISCHYGTPTSFLYINEDGLLAVVRNFELTTLCLLLDNERDPQTTFHNWCRSCQIAAVSCGFPSSTALT